MSNVNLVALVWLFVALILSTVLHELAHGWVAYKLGDETAKESGRLSLNPLNHVDPFMSIILPLLLYLMGMPILGGAKPVPIDTRKLKGGAWGMALVGIAGPLTNLLLGLVLFGVGVFTGMFDFSDGTWRYVFGTGGDVMAQIVLMELGFCIFNMIPIPPLDGSRVLYALAPDGVRDFMETIEPYGIMVIYALLVVASGVFSSLMLGAMNGIISLFRLIFMV